MWQTTKNISNQCKGRVQYVSYKAPAPLHINNSFINEYWKWRTILHNSTVFTEGLIFNTCSHTLTHNFKDLKALCEVQEVCSALKWILTSFLSGRGTVQVFIAFKKKDLSMHYWKIKTTNTFSSLISLPQ